MLSQTSNVGLIIVVLLNLCTSARLNALGKNATNPSSNPVETVVRPTWNAATADQQLPSAVHHARRPSDGHKHEDTKRQAFASEPTPSPSTPPPLAEPLPRPERLANPMPPLDPTNSKLPEFPQRPDAVYFIVAVVGGAKVWGRTLARTLIDMGAPFDSPQGPPLRPLYVDIPPNGRFSAKVLTALCQKSDSQPLSGIIVIGEGHSARAMAMAGTSMGLPVLWAKGGTANLDGMHREIPSPLQVMLQPSAKEILESVRALFLQTHWHSFFVLSDVGASMVMTGAEGSPLNEPPLVPKILPLSANNHDVFRQLAQISRSTRGVVLLLCDLEQARRIMAEAQNLNMVGGHFIWIWADTSSTTEFFDAYTNGPSMPLVDDPFEKQKQPQEPPIHPAPNQRKPPLVVDAPKAAKPAEQGSTRFHLDDFLDRKMDFEDLNPNREANKQRARQRNRNKSKENQQSRDGSRGRNPAPPDRYIIGLNSEAVSDQSDEFGALNKRNQDAVEKPSSEESAEHFFISNLNTDDLVQFAIDSTLPAAANVAEDDTDAESEAKAKRKISMQDFRATPARKANYTANHHVLFHHFKDFPVGFLALRPIRMMVDRHFIRAAVRLLASTWAKVELEARDNAVRAVQRAKTKLNRWGQQELPRGSRTQRRKKRRAAAVVVADIPVNSKLNLPPAASDLAPNSSNKFRYNNTISSRILSDATTRANNQNSAADDHKQLFIISNQPQKSNNQSTHDPEVGSGSSSPPPPAAAKDVADGVRGNPRRRDASANKRHSTWWSSSSHQEQEWLARDTDIRYLKGAPHYRGGCYGRPDDEDVWNAKYFASALKENCQLAMSGQQINDGLVEKALTTNFELLNLVPDNTQRPSKSFYNQQQFDGGDAEQADENPTKWRRVGLVSGRNVHLDTIVWPGGDIVVSGLSARARSVFRVVTALAPPFVMESELDEDGLCLRGLPCHRPATTGRHNLTLMFNAIETRDRLEEDAVEHGNEMPPESEHIDEKVAHVTKCCYGLAMDILDNVATELGFEFHLYIVRDELFGSRHRRFKDWVNHNHNHQNHQNANDLNPNHNQHHHHQQQQQQQQQHQQHGSSVSGGGRKNPENKSPSPQTTTTQRLGAQQRPFGDEEDDFEWNGIMGDLVDGLADMAFAPLSVSKARAEVIDFTAPYFHSGVTLLAAPKTKTEIPLLAFLLPFSPELWIAIFTSLNITAVAVAVYEWLSPFGLNPWGRQRSKNFSMSSALWVMWGLLCGHLVAFKAPKSWPNKFLINVWGGFSVIFVASYTANIAALIAGLFFHNAANMHDASLFTQRVGVPMSTAAETYVQSKDQHLWEHMKKYRLEDIAEGIRGLKNGSLDLLMADSPVLDYYRATDHGCNLQRIGEMYVDDSYAIGMKKGFPLKDSISALIAKYSSNGYLDILTEKWYGGLPCFKFEADIVQPRPLGVEAVAGVFLLLGMGMLMGVIILIFEHWFYKFALPRLRLKPKGTVWKSRNIMFFSQKLYRFINCVELVSPHHAARELVHSIRQGQIASLFQKSIKRKEDEQRRRRKSKAQFFEMIQEIRKAQQNERDNPKLSVVSEDTTSIDSCKSPPSAGVKPKSSPRSKLFATLLREGRSRSNSSVLSIRRFSTDSIFGERMDTIGRRLSRDMSYSPPDLGRRFETFGKTSRLDPNELVTIAAGSKSNENVATTRFDTFCASTMPLPELPVGNTKKPKNKRPALNFEPYQRNEQETLRVGERHDLPVVKEGLEPPIYQEDRTKAVIKDKMHRELRAKYGPPPGSDYRPPLPKKNPELIAKYKKQQQQQNAAQIQETSLSSASARAPVPSPRITKRDVELAPPILSILKTSPSRQSNKPSATTHHNPKMSFERLSREDLLRLSHSSQSEIHEYLSSSLSTRNERQPDPP